MSAQSPAVPKKRPTTARFAPSRSITIAPWLLELTSWVYAQLHDWARVRRIKRNHRILETLPDHILQDIGWPNVNDHISHSQKSTVFKRQS